MKADTTEHIEPSVELPGQAGANSINKWWVLVSIGIGTFMSALDGSVVNTTLPAIKVYFNSRIENVEWIVTIYLLVLSGLLLSFGRLGDMRGHKSVYISGFAIFIASSALCGYASSVTMLILFRGIQALGAAMLSANSPAILTKSFPASQRGQALGLQATMTYLGLTVGPPLGGWLAHQFSWRAVFYINIPVGLIAFLVSLRFIAADRTEHKRERFDIPGAGLFTAGLVALLLALNQGHAWGWLSAPILILLLVSLGLLVIFIRTELRSPYPMLDLSLFKSNVFSTAVGSAVLNYICVYSLIFLLPFYLIEGRGWDTAIAGKILMAQPIVMMIVAPISGTLSDRIGTRWPTMMGMVGLSSGLFLLSRLDSTSTILAIVSSLGIAGLGTGVFISPNNSSLMGSAPRHRQGISAGILATARNMGMVLGVGLAGAIFNTYYPPGAPPSDLFPAFQVSFVIATFVGLLGFLVAAIRPQKINS